MILLARPLLKQIVDAAEAAYPDECCGLLVGRSEASGDLVISRVAPSANVAEGGTRDRFEVDPQLRFDLMRQLADGDEQIVGLYHSHPGQSAQPSARDLDMAWEPGLLWLITAVLDGQALHTTAHMVDAGGSRFREVGLRTDDWRPQPVDNGDGS